MVDGTLRAVQSDARLEMRHTGSGSQELVPVTSALAEEGTRWVQRSLKGLRSGEGVRFATLFWSDQKAQPRTYELNPEASGYRVEGEGTCRDRLPLCRMCRRRGKGRRGGPSHDGYRRGKRRMPARSSRQGVKRSRPGEARAPQPLRRWMYGKEAASRATIAEASRHSTATAGYDGSTQFRGESERSLPSRTEASWPAGRPRRCTGWTGRAGRCGRINSSGSR